MMDPIESINRIQEMASQAMDDINDTPKRFGAPGKKNTQRALQTFFRSSFRVQMGMVSLADRKANILVRLNSILISGMVIFYRNITSYNDMATVSVVIFLITLVASLIFATLAVRPSAESIDDIDSRDIKKLVGQMFLYTHYVKLDEEEFEEAFDIMMQDPKLIYGSMARDLYQFGKVIVKKYKLLRIAYTTFTVGLVMTVLLFLTSILMT